jgi:general secretion pathway protein E/type IV pilus assembly protein PilB
MMPNQALGQRLVEAGAITPDQLRIALIEQQRQHQPLGKLLHRLGFASEKGVIDSLSSQLSLKRFDADQHANLPGASTWIPETLARRLHILPLAWDEATSRLTLASAEPHDPLLQQSLVSHLPAHFSLDVLLASESEIEHGLEQLYGHQLSIDSILKEIEGRQLIEVISGDSPAVRLLDALLADAVREQASDLHLEPERASLRIRYRVDGLMRTVRTLHKSTWPALCSRIKVLAGMNIAESRAPQDGHFSERIASRQIDFRVSSQPTIHGENIVLRLLDREKGITPLENLGLTASELSQLAALLERPDGLLLVTGPTGSGKTTTLYSLLNRLNQDDRHIMTLEDPVEYPLPLIRQTSLSDNVKLDFAGGVRAMLRQDPDILLIGEIRDAETAHMALRAALTGHQVFATLHAANTFSALSRLHELGVSLPMLHGNLNGIIAQRLVPRLCPDCRTFRPATEEEAQRYSLQQTPVAHGCPKCRQQGYLGRIPVLEILSFDSTLDLLLAADSPLPEFIQHARQQGFRRLADKALSLVESGLSTLEAVSRVINLDDRG